MLTLQVNKVCEISSQIKSEIHDFLDLTTIYNNPNTTRYDDSYDSECKMNKHKNKLKIMKQMITDRTINTDECIVASTYTNIEFPYLIKKLRLLNAMLNSHFNPKFQRYKSDLNNNPKYLERLKDRIVFYCFNEQEFNNTHSHIYLKVPSDLCFESVVDKMNELFLKLDDRTNPNRKFKFRVHHETIDDQFAYCDYVLKRYDIENDLSHIVI